MGAFLIPFVFSSALEVQHDLYLGIYFAFVIGFVGAYVRTNEIDVSVIVRRRRPGRAAVIDEYDGDTRLPQTDVD